MGVGLHGSFVGIGGDELNVVFYFLMPSNAIGVTLEAIIIDKMNYIRAAKVNEDVLGDQGKDI